jgi:hypothetical protein
MFRGYSGPYCCAVDETTAGFAWNVSHNENETVFANGVAATMAAALEAAYSALADVRRKVNA